jgi:bisphosphoglycerate-independent phosphoglycerate mutase (AlkP superfamily)
VPAWLVKRRLKGVSRRLVAAREDLRVLDEQIRYVDDDADDARIRALVADDGFAAQEHRDAERHAAAHAGERARLLATIDELETRQDALLDRLAP